MTTPVRIDLTPRSDRGRTLWTPTRRLVTDTEVRLPAPVVGPLKGTLDVTPTGPGWAWQVHEDTPGGTTRYLVVPDTGGQPVHYGDLVEVDPATLDPVVEPEAAWWAELQDLDTNLDQQVIGGLVVGDDLVLRRRNGDELNAGNVRGPQGEEGPEGPEGSEGPEGPAGQSDIVVDTSVGTRVFANGVMVYGNTGWRDVAASLTQNFEVPPPPASGWFRIRRENSQVTVSARLSATSELAGKAMVTNQSVLSGSVPYGFQLPDSFGHYGTARVGTVKVLASLDAAAGNYTMNIRTPSASSEGLLWATGDALLISLTYSTRDNWPTSLPGIPA